MAQTQKLLKSETGSGSEEVKHNVQGREKNKNVSAEMEAFPPFAQVSLKTNISCSHRFSFKTNMGKNKHLTKWKHVTSSQAAGPWPELSLAAAEPATSTAASAAASHATHVFLTR